MALFNFIPNNTSPFQFQPILDGQPYICFVKWNLSGQRWYLECRTVQGALVFNLPVIGSPTGVIIQGITWANGRATVTTNIPHGYKFASTVEITISGCAPVAYNGRVKALITDVDTFTFPLADNPGLATDLGIASYNINIGGGYFTDSVILYRTANRQFETIP